MGILFCAHFQEHNNALGSLRAAPCVYMWQISHLVSYFVHYEISHAISYYTHVVGVNNKLRNICVAYKERILVLHLQLLSSPSALSLLFTQPFILVKFGQQALFRAYELNTGESILLPRFQFFVELHARCMMAQRTRSKLKFASTLDDLSLAWCNFLIGAGFNFAHDDGEILFAHDDGQNAVPRLANFSVATSLLLFAAFHYTGFASVRNGGMNGSYSVNLWCVCFFWHFYEIGHT